MFRLYVHPDSDASLQRHSVLKSDGEDRSNFGQIFRFRRSDQTAEWLVLAITRVQRQVSLQRKQLIARMDVARTEFFDFLSTLFHALRLCGWFRFDSIHLDGRRGSGCNRRSRRPGCRFLRRHFTAIRICRGGFSVSNSSFGFWSNARMFDCTHGSGRWRGRSGMGRGEVVHRIRRERSRWCRRFASVLRVQWIAGTRW